MKYRGHVKSGVIVVYDDVVLPEGAQVRVTVLADEPGSDAPGTNETGANEPSTLYERLESVVGKAEGLPPDLSMRQVNRQATAQEMIDYIDLIISGMMEQPHMYASTPEGLETLFHYLENLRALAATGSRFSNYTDFGVKAGLGSCNFSTRGAVDRGEVVPHATREEHQPLIAFLRQYLAQEGRNP